MTALRTGAAAVLAAETLGRAGRGTAAVVGAGVNGSAAARTFIARGRDVALCSTSTRRAPDCGRRARRRSGDTRDEALGADLLVTVTPGHEVLLAQGSLQPGQHVSLMGADGPGKAEIAVEELAATRSSATTGSSRNRPEHSILMRASGSTPTTGNKLATMASSRTLSSAVWRETT